MQFQKVPLEAIVVDRASRQRSAVQCEDLKASIAKIGLIQPIVVSPRADGRFELRAGERRLTALRELGWAEAPIVMLSELSPVQAAIVELEENIKRQDLPWQDTVRATKAIHELYRQLDPDWTMGETAEALSLTKGTMSLYMTVAGDLADARIAECETVREAWNVIQRKTARAHGEALQELLDLPAPAEAIDGVAVGVLQPGTRVEIPTQLVALTPRGVETIVPKAAPASEPIICADFIDWAPRYAGQKFNLIHCDFPYGVELFAGRQGKGAEASAGYDDSDEVYWALCQTLCRNLDRLMSISGHLMFWTNAEHQRVAKTLRLFAELAPSLEFSRFPLIWLKSDNAGIAAPGWPRHIYELCLLARRGKRPMAEIRGDAYSAPTDKRLHASTKPEPMLRHFMTMLVDGSTSMLDPTCGSGAALRAAESLGAKATLGLELDPKACEVARAALRNARALRAAAGGQIIGVRGDVQTQGS